MIRPGSLTPLSDIVSLVLWDILRRCEEYANRGESA